MSVITSNNANILLNPQLVQLQQLNEKYQSLTPEERIREVYEDLDKILLTSSFGTTAVFLLHLFSRQNIDAPVYFIDTTYHFEETIAYKNKIAQEFNLNVIDVLPDAEMNEMSRKSQIWKHDADLCCSVNKVTPLQEIKEQHKVWISGLMAWQNPFREDLNIFEYSKGMIKFYPLIDVTREELNAHLRIYDLPQHPLKAKGYGSIGCSHCTQKGEGRAGRWAGKQKTECGLHT